MWRQLYEMIFSAAVDETVLMTTMYRGEKPTQVGGRHGELLELLPFIHLGLRTTTLRHLIAHLRINETQEATTMCQSFQS